MSSAASLRSRRWGAFADLYTDTHVKRHVAPFTAVGAFAEYTVTRAPPPAFFAYFTALLEIGSDLSRVPLPSHHDMHTLVNRALQSAEGETWLRRFAAGCNAQRRTAILASVVVYGTRCLDLIDDLCKPPHLLSSCGFTIGDVATAYPPPIATPVERARSLRHFVKVATHTCMRDEVCYAYAHMYPDD